MISEKLDQISQELESNQKEIRFKLDQNQSQIRQELDQISQESESNQTGISQMLDTNQIKIRYKLDGNQSSAF